MTLGLCRGQTVSTLRALLATKGDRAVTIPVVRMGDTAEQALEYVDRAVRNVFNKAGKVLGKTVD